MRLEVLPERTGGAAENMATDFLMLQRYPTEGVARYRHRDYEASVQSFREWLMQHPDGPWTIRARNHLRAALARTSLD